MEDVAASPPPPAPRRRWLAKTLGWSVVLVLAVLTLLSQCSGYDSRRHVADAFRDADPVKEAIDAFYRGQKRWPDAAAGERFAFVAGLEGDVPVWTCKPLDISAKHLPAGCR